MEEFGESKAPKKAEGVNPVSGLNKWARKTTRVRMGTVHQRSRDVN